MTKDYIFSLAEHLVTPRACNAYTHHGIYIGEARVVHYSGLADGLSKGKVEITGIDEFSCGNGISITHHNDSPYSKEQIIERALSRVGEDLYGVFENNCEHFVLWCILDRHDSPQVDRACSATPLVAGQVVKTLGTRVIATSGAVAGLSGSGMMSGLATVGSIVGAGAVAGVGVIGGVGAMSTAHSMNKTFFSDNAAQPKEERSARKAARIATNSTVVASTAASIATIGACGSVAGFSAAGITSGLAAIGSVVGGGMLAGTMIVTAAPAVATAAAGFGVYKAYKWIKKK